MTGRILVVDDLLPNIKLLEAKLNAEYYVVFTAKSGKEALEFLENNQVDIILLDVMMPEMDGFEVCRQVKTNPALKHIPVIMVTALSDVEDRVTGLKAGADDFLTKPINDTILFARLKSLLRLKGMIDELRVRGESLNQFGIEKNTDNLDFNSLSGSRILVVDDDIAQSGIIQKTLSAQKVLVDVINDESNVLDSLRKVAYDVIIISTQLLKQDSLRICSQIRSVNEFKRIPILLLVDEHETAILAKGLEIGANDYLTTPLDNTELITRVNTQVKKKAYQDELMNTLQNNATMAVKDALTGIFNRRYFDIYATKIIEQNRKNSAPAVIGVADIDFFKNINDTYGHLAGDEVIKYVARAISEDLRLTDLIVRYGGEEFVFILSSISLPSAKDIAERIRKKIESSPIPISSDESEQLIKITISIGLTDLRNNDDLKSVLDRADQALYKAKESGRNMVQYI